MTQTPASPALSEADQAMRDSLIAFFQDRYWQVPRLITDEVDALLAGPLATLRAERDAAVTRANEEEVSAALDRAFREITEARSTAVEATLREREAEIEKLKIAFHDAIRRPLGVTPDSGAEFYDPRMADEAEARRAEARVLWWLPGGGVTR